MSDPGQAAAKYRSQHGEQHWQELQSSSQALSQEEAIRRLEKYGLQVLKAQRELSPLMLFLNHSKSSIMLILIFTTILSAFLQDWTDAIIILFIVFGSVILSFMQENNAHNTADKLRAQVTMRTDILRDEQKREIFTQEVVPRDVVALSDGRLGSKPFGVPFLGFIAGIVTAQFIYAELVKRWSYRNQSI